jgi:hypothetical protein
MGFGVEKGKKYRVVGFYSICVSLFELQKKNVITNRTRWLALPTRVK